MFFFRWQGDYGGQFGKWFPATFCEEINIANGVRQTPETPENMFDSEVNDSNFQFLQLLLFYRVGVFFVY